MAIWYVNPLSTSTTGVGTYANPFGMMNNTGMDAYVNNGDEIRILGKDITTISTYNWTMKPYRVNDGSTAFANTANSLGLKVNTGTAYTGTGYIIYCVELDMFCSLNYNASYYTYYLGCGESTLNYLLELNNLPLNTILTFHAISSSTYNIAQNRYLCCFTATKSYLTISDNWTSATTRSTGVNKIGSFMFYSNTSSYYTYMFSNVTNSTIDCSNTVYASNALQPSYNDILHLGPIITSNITLKNVSHMNPASTQGPTYISLSGTCYDINLNIKYFTPLRSGIGNNYSNSKIALPNIGSKSNFINITIDHYFATYDTGTRFHYSYKQNLTYTINNIVFGYATPAYYMTSESVYYSMFGLLTSYLGTDTKTILNIGKVYISQVNQGDIIVSLPLSKFYVFDTDIKNALDSKLIDINLLSNFDVKYSALSIGMLTSYYPAGIALYIPEFKYGRMNLIDNLYTTNLSTKTLFTESLTNDMIFVKNIINNSNSTTEYDFQKNSNGPLRIKQCNIVSNTLSNLFPNFVGNFSANDAIVLKNNNNISKFIPINSASIASSEYLSPNVIKVEEDNITYKTISPAISMYPYTNSKTIFYAGKSLFKHALTVKAGKLYNLKFSLYTPGFSAGEIIVKVIDDATIYPIVLNNASLTGWETINFDNYSSSRDQYLTIVIELNMSNQKCKLTLSDIILTQLN